MQSQGIEIESYDPNNMHFKCGDSVQKLSGKPFRNGEKTAVIVSFTENTDGPKKLAAVFSDKSICNLEQLKIVVEDNLEVKPSNGIDYSYLLDWANFRPFENADEAERYWDAKLAFKHERVGFGERKSVLRVVAIGKEGVILGVTFYSYKDAFDLFEVVQFKNDEKGSPFGVPLA